MHKKVLTYVRLGWPACDALGPMIAPVTVIIDIRSAAMLESLAEYPALAGAAGFWGSLRSRFTV